jgi:hypothetical protein
MGGAQKLQVIGGMHRTHRRKTVVVRRDDLMACRRECAQQCLDPIGGFARRHHIATDGVPIGGVPRLGGTVKNDHVWILSDGAGNAVRRSLSPG